MSVFKDLSSPTYWENFGEIGVEIGRANMPTPKEAADTVLSLKSELSELRKERDEYKARLFVCIQSIESVSMEFASRLDSLRHEARGMR